MKDVEGVATHVQGIGFFARETNGRDYFPVMNFVGREPSKTHVHNVRFDVKRQGGRSVAHNAVVVG